MRDGGNEGQHENEGDSHRASLARLQRQEQAPRRHSRPSPLKRSVGRCLRQVAISAAQSATIRGVAGASWPSSEARAAHGVPAVFSGWALQGCAGAGVGAGGLAFRSAVRLVWGARVGQVTRRLGRVFAIVFVLLVVPRAGWALEQDRQLWLNGTVQGPIHGRLLYYVEVQTRSGGDFDRPTYQAFVRPMIGVRVNNVLALHLGYAMVFDYSSAGEDALENRFYVQSLWTLPKLGPLQISNRTRVEYRLRTDGDDGAWRARTLLRFCAPLFGGEKKWFRPILSGEVFAHLSDADWGPRQGFDQVRSFGGFEIPLVDQWTAEIGYLNQYTNRAGPNLMNHVLAVTLIIRT